MRDTFWNGRLTVWQPRRGAGYRFNLDPILLASFTPPAKQVLELGAGCGILGLLLLASNKANDVTCIERQPNLAQMCRRNADENGFAGRMRVHCQDLRQAALPPSDLVVFNPPYFPATARRLSPEPGRDAARNERHGTLHDFIAAAARVLSPDGHVAAIIPTQRSKSLRAALQDHHFNWLRRQLVVPRTGAAPKHMLILAQPRAPNSARDMPLPPPEPALVVHRGNGRDFTPDVEAWVTGEARGEGRCGVKPPVT